LEQTETMDAEFGNVPQRLRGDLNSGMGDCQ